MKAAGRDDVLAHLAARTDVVALEALNRACTLAEWTGARIHIVHESTARSLPFIRFWKGRGVDLTVETLPAISLPERRDDAGARRRGAAHEPADPRGRPAGAALGGRSRRHHRHHRDRPCPACRIGEVRAAHLGSRLRVPRRRDLGRPHADRGARRQADAGALRRAVERRAGARLRPLRPQGRDPPGRRCRPRGGGPRAQAHARCRETAFARQGQPLRRHGR